MLQEITGIRRACRIHVGFHYMYLALQRAFLWSEITLDEAVHGYKTNSSSEKEQWADTLVNTCDSLLQ